MLNYPIFIMKPTLISFAYFIVCLYSPLQLLTVDGENIIQASYLKRVRRKASDRACMILKQQTWFVIAADCTVSGFNAFNKIINNEQCLFVGTHRPGAIILFDFFTGCYKSKEKVIYLL